MKRPAWRSLSSCLIAALAACTGSAATPPSHTRPASVAVTSAATGASSAQAPPAATPSVVAVVTGYYRAILGAAPDPAYAAEASAPGMPPQPTLYLHGEDDGCMGVAFAAGAGAGLSRASRVEILPGVGHFLHVERPDVVNPMIVEWLRGG